MVVIAEGLRSQSRKLVTSAEVTDLGMYFAYLTLDRRDTDDRWWNWMHAPGHRAVHLRPDNLGTTRALLTFISDVRGLETLNRADQIGILRATFADIGGPAPRILGRTRRCANVFRQRRPVPFAGVAQGPGSPPRRFGVSATPPLAAREPASPSSAPTCWPANYPAPATTQLLFGGTSGS